MKNIQSAIGKLSLVMSFFLLLSSGLFAQSVLYYYSGESIEVKILSEDKRTITFVPYEDQDRNPITIDKDQLRRIYYKNKKVKRRFITRYDYYNTFGRRLDRFIKARKSRRDSLRNIKKGEIANLAKKETPDNKPAIKNTPDTIAVIEPQIKENPKSGKEIENTGKIKPVKVGGNSSKEIQKDISYKDAIKVNLSSIIFNNLEVGFEWRIRKKISYELSGGIIGLGMPLENESLEWDQKSDYYGENGLASFQEKGKIGLAGGFLLKTGPKFTFIQENSLTGIYVKPELVYVGYQVNGYAKYNYPSEPQFESDFNWNYTNNQVGLLVNLGYQFLLGKRVLLDINAGMGYAHQFDNLTIEGNYLGQLGVYGHKAIPHIYETDYEMEYQYGYYRYQGLAINGNIKLGILLNSSTP